LADPSAELRIGTTEEVAAGLVSGIIGELLQHHPPARLHIVLADPPAVCTENLIRVDDVMESPKLAE
jgi:hypothetical protein